jgi:hypothetical protein
MSRQFDAWQQSELEPDQVLSGNGKRIKVSNSLGRSSEYLLFMQKMGWNKNQIEDMFNDLKRSIEFEEIENEKQDAYLAKHNAG